MCWPIYNWTLGNKFFLSKNIFGGPPKGVNLKKSVGSLNLCLKKPDSLQKEPVQSEHPALRKCPKCAKILGYFVVGPKHQNWTIFWMFSWSKVIGLSWFLLQWVRLLETQHMITISWKFHFFLGWPPLGDPQKYFSTKKNYFLMFSYILVTTLDTCCN